MFLTLSQSLVSDCNGLDISGDLNQSQAEAKRPCPLLSVPRTSGLIQILDSNSRERGQKAGSAGQVGRSSSSSARWGG